MLPASEITWDYPETELGPMRVVVLIPEREADARLPVLVAMHGRGEALKGPELGARGWVDDYTLPTTVERLHRPPITLEDLHGFADEARLARLNSSLAERPYQGLIVVCPYTPDVLPADESIDKALPLARFVVETVLPRAYRETPAIGTPQTTGIDGVSLGGRAALGIGLLRPTAFGVVASLQAALRSDNSADLLRRAREAKAQKPDLLRAPTHQQRRLLPQSQSALGLRLQGCRHPHRARDDPRPARLRIQPRPRRVRDADISRPGAQRPAASFDAPLTRTLRPPTMQSTCARCSPVAVRELHADQRAASFGIGEAARPDDGTAQRERIPEVRGIDDELDRSACGCRVRRFDAGAAQAEVDDAHVAVPAHVCVGGAERPRQADRLPRQCAEMCRGRLEAANQQLPWIPLMVEMRAAILP